MYVQKVLERDSAGERTFLLPSFAAAAAISTDLRESFCVVSFPCKYIIQDQCRSSISRK